MTLRRLKALDFCNTLNRPSTFLQLCPARIWTTQQLSAAECSSFLNVLSPLICRGSNAEVLINNLKNGRASGAYGIFPEFLKYAGPPVVEALLYLFENVWLSGHIQSEWRDGIIIPVYKGKFSMWQLQTYLFTLHSW